VTDLPSSGIYQLFFHLCRPLRINVGRLGCFTFPPGVYAYTGSAKRNLEARLRRHASPHKKLRWHIDYLLAEADADRINSPLAESAIVNIALYAWECGAECRWNQWLQRHAGGRPIIDKFGASDCRSACRSHLLLLPESPAAPQNAPPILPPAAVIIPVADIQSTRVRQA